MTSPSTVTMCLYHIVHIVHIVRVSVHHREPESLLISNLTTYLHTECDRCVGSGRLLCTISYLRRSHRLYTAVIPTHNKPNADSSHDAIIGLFTKRTKIIIYGTAYMYFQCSLHVLFTSCDSHDSMPVRVTPAVLTFPRIILLPQLWMN